MSIHQLQNNFISITPATSSMPAFTGRKKDVVPKTDLSQIPDSVCFSSKPSAKTQAKTQEQVFDEVEKYFDDLYLGHEYDVHDIDSQYMLSSSAAMKQIIKMFAAADGTKTDSEAVCEFLTKLAEKPARMKKDTITYKVISMKNQAFWHDYLLKRNLKSLVNLMKRTPQKENESLGDYLKRVNSLNEKRNKLLEKGRISIIKSKLKYEPESSAKDEKLIELTEEERKHLIAAINEHIQYNELYIPLLKDKSSMKELIDAWQYAYLCDMEIPSNDPVLEKGCVAVLQRMGRYNSQKPPKNKELCGIEVVEKDYKSEFNPEPVYRWILADYPNDFINNFPKNGEIYSYPTFQSCSTNKKYAEPSYRDDKDSLNVKFVIHPKTSTSKAYNLGVGQEVIYPPRTQFRVLDKTLVENKVESCDKKNKTICRWEIHLQEV